MGCGASSMSNAGSVEPKQQKQEHAASKAKVQVETSSNKRTDTIIEPPQVKDSIVVGQAEAIQSPEENQSETSCVSSTSIDKVGSNSDSVTPNDGEPSLGNDIADANPDDMVPSTQEEEQEEAESFGPNSKDYEEPNASISTTTSTTKFERWAATVNNGKKTTTLQQIELAVQLCNDVLGPEEEPRTASEILTSLEQTPLDVDELVTWKGFRLDWFLNTFCQSPLMKHLNEFGCQLWFIRKVCIVEMIQRSSGGKKKKNGSMSGPFVDHMDSVVRHWDLALPENGSPIVQDPTVFLSYTGAYTLDFLVQSMTNLLKEQPTGDTYIWMDIFCVDQFAWTGKGRSVEMQSFRESFMQDLQGRIQDIHRTALVLEKWDNVMVTLGQIWVLWEIFNTAQAKADLSILLPPSEMQRFIDDCLEPGSTQFDSILKSLATVDAAKAQAENDGDREVILDRMKQSGLHNVNSLVLSVIREWLCRVGEDHVAKQRRDVEEGPNPALLDSLAMMLKDQGKFVEAEALVRESLSLRQKHFGDDHELTLSSMQRLAHVLRAQGKFMEAGPLFRQALDGRRLLLGDSHPQTLDSMNGFGRLMYQLGKYDEAEPLLRKGLAGERRVLGDRASTTLYSMNGLALLLKHKGELDEAEALYREGWEGMKETLGEQHKETLTCLGNIAVLLEARERYQEAEELHRKVLEGQRQQFGALHPDTLRFVNNLATVLQKQGKLSQAEPLYRETLAGQKELMGPQHPLTLVTMLNLSILLHGLGQREESQPMMEEAVFGFAVTLGRNHPQTINAGQWWNGLYNQSEQQQEQQ